MDTATAAMRRVAACLPGAVRCGDEAAQGLLLARITTRDGWRELAIHLARHADDRALRFAAGLETSLDLHALYVQLRSRDAEIPARVLAGEREYQRQAKAALRRRRAGTGERDDDAA